MSEIARKRCFIHGFREAVARCPDCGRFYCRECITEHEDRVICTSCLQKFSEKIEKSRYHLAEFYMMLKLVTGVLVLWLFFYFLGQALLSIPTSFHDGSVWQETSGEE